MEKCKALLDEFAVQSQAILGGDLVGVYLHGSAAMGCFHRQRSDLDLLVVVKQAPTRAQKRRFMEMAAALNRRGPAKGLEFSILRQEVCRPFVYPTPFELHFSPVHLEWYQTDPEGYIEKMNGTDRDLAAHCMVLFHRGKTLCGKAARAVFAEVDREIYLDSIWHDVKSAREEIAEHTVYCTLNLCRALAYKQEGLILSKQEGADWGLRHLPSRYAGLLSAAAAAYQTGAPLRAAEPAAREYAEWMLAQFAG